MPVDDATGVQVSRAKIPPLAGHGELAALVREHDWSSTPLGPADEWPQSLRSVVNILLTSRYAMWMGWGEELIMLYNDAYRPTLGIKHPWALGKPASQVWAEIWPDIDPRIQTVLSTGHATYDEALLLFLERSGFREETYHTFSYSPLTDDAGCVSGMLCVVTEETDRVISERRMTTLRELASALGVCNTEAEVLAAVEQQLGVNNKDLPFTLTYLFDPGGEARLACVTGITAGNPACPLRIPADTDSPWPARELWNSSAAFLLNDPGRWQESVPLPKGAWDRPPSQIAVVPIRQQGHDRPAGFLVVGLHPYRRYDASYAGFVDLVSGQLASGIASARAYDEERRRAESLAELDHAKTQFFSNVSHEFRTPLTLMLAPLEDMLAKPTEQVGEENRETLAVVHRNGLRLLRLVNSLLDFSRIEAGRVRAHYVSTDLAMLTAELASNFRSATERAGLRFVVDCPELPEPAYVDREMWEKIVFNLLSNALKFTFEGGITVQLRYRDGRAELRVIDTGTGIPEHELPHLFERFHRVEGARGRTFEGSGIGLALVQELVRLHEGSIQVESKLGEGSTFAVSLPFGSAHLPPERIGHPSASTLSTAVPAEAFVEEADRWLPGEPRLTNAIVPEYAETVLVVDDNSDMREYVRRLLGAKYNLISATNGEEALRLAHSENPGLVLSDVMMPGLDGLSLLQALRDHPATRTTPVILLSARAGEEARSEGMDAGADDYIVKPFSARELLARVGAHLKLARIRKDAEAALRVSEERLQQAFTQAPVGVAVVRGPDRIIELANAEYQKFFPGRELLGRPLRQAIPDLTEASIEVIDMVFRSGEPFVGNEYLMPLDRDGDGVREDCWFTFVYQPLKEASGEVSGIVIVSVDVTTHVRARQGLERANRELEEFAYVSSHDMQEPLRMVNIYTHLLLQSLVPDSAETEEYAAFVRQGVLRMEHLIRDLLSYSRVIHSEGARVGTADLAESLSLALQTLKTRIDETEAIIVADTLPTVRGDTAQLAHVFQNLLTNSLKYRKTDTHPEIHISAERAGHQWIVAVRDNGIGFEQQYAERIFGLFKRLHKDEYAGTGLGLAICQRIVERFGGGMWAEGRPGDGATFYFTVTGVEAQ
jgi:PAS domain S-box-containing protein